MSCECHVNVKVNVEAGSREGDRYVGWEGGAQCWSRVYRGHGRLETVACWHEAVPACKQEALALDRFKPVIRVGWKCMSEWNDSLSLLSQMTARPTQSPSIALVHRR